MTLHRTRIKICGIKDAAMALHASRCGADAIGINFHKPSPRYAELEHAAAITHALPPYVMAVGLFVNLSAHEVREILARVPLQMLQFQGEEEPDFCESFGLPYVRAVRMEEGADLLEYARRFSRARALLLDAHVPGLAGGTGRSFDWKAIPRDLPIPVILSGGLTPENVGRAVREVKPWAVDVASGVEAERGVKDPRKIEEFIRSVRREDAG
jgi:Phosphoribosylanthranilate isomerase